MVESYNEFMGWSEGSCRRGLSEIDMRFIRHVVGDWGDGEMDLVLDDEELVESVLRHPGNLPISMELYFYVIVRRSLVGVGVKSRDVADYVVWMLLQRVRSRKAFNNELNGGRTFFYVMDYMQRIAEAEGDDVFYMRANLGDQALYMTGLFEEHIRARTERRGAPDLRYFEMVGGEQYRMLREHALAKRYGLVGVYEVLGGAFRETRKGLNDLSERLVSLGDPFR